MGAVLGVLTIAVLAASAYAFVHAAMQRADAYPAADKLTKPVWLAIIGGCGVLPVLLPMMGLVIAACASSIYLVDVRPRLLEVQGKSH
ncbi:DUF2516 family protein [[Mycobacterium] kokjensenii]|uniref:DUF2516 family protein n=1 Tax=[Mycobacterium] kokjensenii TaxID=3064287 RepID=A0ABN9MXV1_9MYCO|nr:DUF2516 family protein [Mycolicibacter sp. MU0083]CAJ1493620.1 DUF2516 family protein [Mycolicibacter sp. MU0083]